MSSILKIHLKTLFVLDSEDRILSTREPQASKGPVFFLTRSPVDCVWGIRTGVPADLAKELERLAREEPPISDYSGPQMHADGYKSVLEGKIDSGPAFIFPQAIPRPQDVVLVEDEQLLNRHFSGWMPGEIRAGRAPVMAVMEDCYPVSICFCARRSNVAAEAGVQTAAGYTGRGFGSCVTAAWALAVRESGLIPFYSTDWSNEPSLVLARKLGLSIYAADWSISD